MRYSVCIFMSAVRISKAVTSSLNTTTTRLLIMVLLFLTSVPRGPGLRAIEVCLQDAFQEMQPLRLEVARRLPRHLAVDSAKQWHCLPSLVQRYVPASTAVTVRRSESDERMTIFSAS